MSLRYAVLGLLAQSPGSGYELLRRFDTSMAHVWAATQSQLYTELGKLRDDALIEVTGTGARNRKDYAITPRGRQELAEWLAHPAHEVRRDAGLLQVFLLSETTPARAIRHFEELSEQANRRFSELQHLDETIPWDATPQDRFGRLALRYGIHQAEAQRRWADDAVRELRG